MKINRHIFLALSALCLVFLLCSCNESEHGNASNQSGTTVSETSVTTTTATTTTTTATTTTTTAAPPSDESLVLISDYLPNVHIDLKYATEDNFTGQRIYDFTEPSLRYSTLKKLIEVQKELNSLGYSLLIWDAYRPYSAQEKLWEICPDPKYVSNPKTGRLSHCRGNTVDVSIVLLDGSKVELPSDFDDFSARADRDYSDVSDEAANNALFLERIMEKHGFVGYSGEWWHYSDKTDYPIISE